MPAGGAGAGGDGARGGRGAESGLPSLSGMSEPSRHTLASTLAKAMAQRRRDLQQRAHDADDGDEWSD